METSQSLQWPTQPRGFDLNLLFSQDSKSLGLDARVLARKEVQGEARAADVCTEGVLGGWHGLPDWTGPSGVSVWPRGGWRLSAERLAARLE